MFRIQDIRNNKNFSFFVGIFRIIGFLLLIVDIKAGALFLSGIEAVLLFNDEIEEQNK